MPPSSFDLEYERACSRRRSAQRMFPMSRPDPAVSTAREHEPAGAVQPSLEADAGRYHSENAA